MVIAIPPCIDGQGWHALAGRVDQVASPGVNRTGTPISHPTGECRSRSKPAGHSKDNPQGCQPVHEPDQPREQTNRTPRPRVTALTEQSAHPNPSSLPVMAGALCFPAAYDLVPYERRCSDD